MTTFAIIGWLLAIGLGIGWWWDHRGKEGIRRDFEDFKRVAGQIKDKVS